MLQGKHILLGITGSIAAYKSAHLVRLFKKAGAEVRVVLSPSASAFVTPLTLSTLSGNPVYSTFEKNNLGEWVNHVDLALWADIMIIAPASANTISKMASGACDNLLMAVYMSAKCPVAIAPAMDLDMYAHPATTQNIERLKTFGHLIIDAQEGELASGLSGKGRMEEPELIFQFVENYFRPNSKVAGKKILITAGPTREALDPVRYITNHSTGKMGYKLAAHAIELGAEVILVSGPVHLTAPKGCTLVSVNSAEEMYQAVLKNFAQSDIIIYSAAVADYSPLKAEDKKIKKSDDLFHLELTKTKDIAYETSRIKNNNQFTVGFALETDQEIQHAQQKLEKKKFDCIVLNSLNDRGAGFGHDTNKITIFGKNNFQKEFPLKSKEDVAKDIFNVIIDLLP